MAPCPDFGNLGPRARCSFLSDHHKSRQNRGSSLRTPQFSRSFAYLRLVSVIPVICCAPCSYSASPQSEGKSALLLDPPPVSSAEYLQEGKSAPLLDPAGCGAWCVGNRASDFFAAQTAHYKHSHIPKIMHQGKERPQQVIEPFLSGSWWCQVCNVQWVFGKIPTLHGPQTISGYAWQKRTIAQGSPISPFGGYHPTSVNQTDARPSPLRRPPAFWVYDLGLRV